MHTYRTFHYTCTQGQPGLRGHMGTAGGQGSQGIPGPPGAPGDKGSKGDNVRIVTIFFGEPEQATLIDPTLKFS